MLFLEAVGVREYCCMAVENRLAAMCFARDEPSSKRVGGVGLQPKAAKATFVALHSAESRQSHSRCSRC